jgi:hypothetical protein
MNRWAVKITIQREALSWHVVHPGASRLCLRLDGYSNACDKAKLNFPRGRDLAEFLVPQVSR